MLYILFNLFLLSKCIFLSLLSMRLTYWRGGVGGGEAFNEPRNTGLHHDCVCRHTKNICEESEH